MMGAGKSTNFEPTVLDKYTTMQYFLNKGASGNVYGPIPWQGSKLAIKQSLFADGIVTGDIQKRMEKKKDMWTSLEHKNLLSIHVVDLTRLPKLMLIVMDFAAGGSLNKTLRSLESGNKLPIDVVTDWTKQIADGMLYLHEQHIVHRDLKSSNILLMEPFDAGNPHTILTLRIADFDEIKEHDQTATMTTFFGTCAYMAPEVMKNQQFSKASDVWSFGVVIWEMLSGDIPHKGLNQQTLMFNTINGKRDDLPLGQSFPEDYKQLLKRCWESTHEDRISFRKISIALQRVEMTEGGEQKMPSIGPGTGQSPQGISAVPEMTEGREQEMSNIGPGTDQSPHGISSVPGMAEGGEEEMPGIASGTAQRSSSFPADRQLHSRKTSPRGAIETYETDTTVQGSTSTRVEINEHTLNNIAIPEIRKVLVDRVNPDFGLRDKLLALKALSRSDIAEVAELSSSQEKNTRLLELVSKNDKLEEFFNALKDTHQGHLVNYVTAKGVYSQDYGVTWPLTEREIEILDVNQEQLVELLDFSGDEIISKLYAANFLNRRQKEFICKRSCDFEKAEVLLDFLYRSSMSGYWKMIAYLSDTKQEHAAKLLLDGGALVRVHNVVDGESAAVTAAENEIVTRIESILSNVNLGEGSNSILERLQLKLFAARVGH